MNEGLIERFRVLQAHYRLQNDVGRSIAYGKIATVLRTLAFRIERVSQVEGLPGIGPKAKAKIQEYLDTGRIAASDKTRGAVDPRQSSREKVIARFLKVWGVGPARAAALYDRGMRTLSDLRKNRGLLTGQQRIGLRYYKDFLKRVPRDQILALVALMRHYLNRAVMHGEWSARSSPSAERSHRLCHASPGATRPLSSRCPESVRTSKDFKIAIAGSYRRGMPTSGDIDCLVQSRAFRLNEMVSLLQKRGIITDVLSMRSQKFMGVARCPGGGRAIRLDIQFVQPNEWGSALLYFTGSKGFNLYIRGIAKKRGMLLNEHGLFSAETGERIASTPTEESVFEALGLEFTPPERR